MPHFGTNYCWRPGFGGGPFYPELNVDKKVLRNFRMHLEALDNGAGPDVDLATCTESKDFRR
jgi:hypothetical protein